VLAGVFDATFGSRMARHHLSPKTTAIVTNDRAKLYTGNVPDDIPAADRESVAAGVRESYLAGVRAVMLASAGTCVLAAIVAGIGIPGRRAKAPTRA
jgi:hypothetical protein